MEEIKAEINSEPIEGIEGEEQHPLLSEQDIAQLEEVGISIEEANSQIQKLKQGVSYQQIIASASLERGIISISPKERSFYLDQWYKYCSLPDHKVIKFVPASGAATRMFKELYPLANDEAESIKKEDLNDFQQEFFDGIEQFAFFGELSEACLRFQWNTIKKLLETEQYQKVAQTLLSEKGLNFGMHPKGVIPFHKYPDKSVRTPIAEHLAEGALYTKNFDGLVHIHFTVSEEYLHFFQNYTERERRKMEDIFGVLFDISFSTQKSSTNTLSLDSEGKPFHTKEGTLLLRPGGHGTLIENLNELDADVIFIKNIDNITPDHLKSNTILYKKLLGGILITIQEQIFSYLHILEKEKVSKSQLEEITGFLYDTLCIEIPQKELLSDKDLAERLYAKLNRPLRVCGIVHNEGEPGGGPYIIREADGSSSLQILESSQINMQDSNAAKIWSESKFFNPVDIVCSKKNYKDEYFDLSTFINEQTSFISEKTYEGEAVKALEKPGLWNGAMDKWNTLFIEVPTETFTPVKTVNDLLKEVHQEVTNKD